MTDIIEKLRSGLDNADDGELGGVIITMRLAADEIERLEAENKRLQSIVKSAYIEGWFQNSVHLQVFTLPTIETALAESSYLSSDTRATLEDKG